MNPPSSTIRNLTKGETYKAAAFPPFMQSLIEAGGLSDTWRDA